MRRAGQIEIERESERDPTTQPKARNRQRNQLQMAEQIKMKNNKGDTEQTTIAVCNANDILLDLIDHFLHYTRSGYTGLERKNVTHEI